jgi:hypothetical protein
MRRLLVVLLLVACCGCQKGDGPAAGVTRMDLPPNAVEVEPKARRIARGQLLYVPCYSHIYLLEGKPYNLAITLSVRNTSRTEKLVLQSVAYHDSSGSLVKELVSKEIELAPLSVVEMFVHEEDKSGGSGASFLVKWVAESALPEPVVEAAMVGSSGSLGISFLTRAKVLEELSPGSHSPSPSPSPNAL